RDDRRSDTLTPAQPGQGFALHTALRPSSDLFGLGQFQYGRQDYILTQCEDNAERQCDIYRGHATDQPCTPNHCSQMLRQTYLLSRLLLADVPLEDVPATAVAHLRGHAQEKWFVAPWLILLRDLYIT